MRPDPASDTTPHPDLHIIGVRHHSPACARLVAHTIRTLRPRHVLIEGPSDMNGRVHELLLDHVLPVAVFSFEPGAGSWSPFCEYSPEWQALAAAAEVGAEARFIDLPAWHPAFRGVENRYGDHERRYDRSVAKLCERLSIDGFDALWDHLFEDETGGDAGMAALQAKLATYFAGLRGDAPGGPRDGPREAFMRDQIAVALARGGPVVVVCGGFHAPALADVQPASAAAGDPLRWPEVATPEDAGSYLVPWSYHRLDAFTGYAAGMPSPGFYDAVFAVGPTLASEQLLRVAVDHLRLVGQHISSADLVAALALAGGLARLRGHTALLRTDLLDGLAASLVKDALHVPLPWTERAMVHRDTHPLIVALLTALSGDRRGRLHASTPMPPLVGDVERELARCDLIAGVHARAIELALAEPHQLERSRVLHRLRVLAIPGFLRQRGPSWAPAASGAQVGGPLAARPTEVWKIAAAENAPSALIEAARYGPTLESAAAAKLAEALADPTLGLATLTQILTELVFVGIEALTARVMPLVRTHIEAESDLGALGAALALLLDLFGGDVLFGSAKNAELGQVIGLGYTRGVWLLEELGGVTADDAHIGAVATLRDAARRGPALGLRADELTAVCERRTRAADAPAAVRGACLGALWSLEALVNGSADAVAGVRRLALPTQLGDFLTGLFALARDQTVRGDDVLRVIDEVIAALPENDFLVALPSLRLAFDWFPPRERATIAERLATLHGQSPSTAHDLLVVGDDPLLIARGAQLDGEVEALLVRYALLEATS